MSDKRRADMDAIEIAQLPPLPSDAPTINDDTSPIDTIISPIPGTPTIVPGDEVDTSGKVKPKPEENDEEARARVAFTERQRENQLLERQDQRQLNLLGKIANSSVGTLNSVKNGIGRIPTPIGLAVPVITLLILFFLIVQVNGNSRFGWLWLVLTNNAHVEAGNNNPASSSPAVNIPSYASVTTPLKTFETTTTPLSSFATIAAPLVSTSTFVSLSQELN